MEFVNFHTHTGYSYADGFGPVLSHVERVAALGMSALFLSEHGNVNSHAALERHCRAVGIKPGYGCEVYFAPPGERRKFHLTVFAMNQEGYRNLNRLITQSYLDFYQYPTVSWESLVKHNAGLAVLSGCADSFISCSLLGGKSFGEKRLEYTEKDFATTLHRVERFQKVFGDRFFLEVQRFPGLPRTCVLNPAFAEISKITGVPLFATADVHYAYPYQNKMQTVLHASRRKSSVAITEATWEYDILLTYPESDKEITDDLVATGLSLRESEQAVSQTALLAGRCTVELPKAQPVRFPLPIGTKTLRFFNKQIMDGWRNRIAQRPELVDRVDEYQDRIRSEMKVIKEKDFLDYFLVTGDLVRHAKDVDDVTVGPARGSAASSLVCYLLGITEIDPLHPVFDKMVFERFLDPTRSDPPDIDLDFDDELRIKTFKRAQSIYGDDCVGSVGNHTRYRGKSSIEGVARAHSISKKTFEPVLKRVWDRTETDERVDDSIADVLEAYATDVEVANLLKIHSDKLAQAVALEGNPHSMGIHAAGFVVSSVPISEVCALYTREKGTGRNKQVAQVIPYEKRDAEYLNFLKMDFLGLKAMGMIGLCRKWTGMPLNELYRLFYAAYDHEKIYGENKQITECFAIDDVTGIFQYEGTTTRSLMRRLKPETFDHIAAVGALSRPGPYYGGQADEYIAVKNGEKDWNRIHPSFDQHVGWTYGQIVYQEQIMWILRDLAGFDVATVLRVRKIIGKKLGEHQFTALWNQFREGCVRNGLDEDGALRVWGAITTAAGYAFNIPHAYSYGLIAWWQMWFKIHHPTEFYAASLAKNGDGKDDIARRTALLQDAQRHKIDILQFDPNLSQANWVPDGVHRGIRPGLTQIPRIAEATASDILTWRDARRMMVDWDHYVNVRGIGLPTVQKIVAFVNGPDPLGINKTRDQLWAFRKQLLNGEFEGSGLPSPEEYVQADDLLLNDHVAFVGLIDNIVHRDEVETAYSRTGRDIAELRAELEDKYNGNTKKATIFAYDETGEVALRISAWQYPRLAGVISALDPAKHMIAVWGRTYDSNNAIQIKMIWVLDLD